MLDPDTYLSRRTRSKPRCARRAALGALGEALASGAARAGSRWCDRRAITRCPTEAMGFCLLNNVAVGAEGARARRGEARSPIVDIDVHHGNGTQAIYWRDPDVLYVSTHQYPFYPGTGDLRERGEGAWPRRTVNVPLSEGADDVVYAEAIDEVVVPAVASLPARRWC